MQESLCRALKEVHLKVFIGSAIGIGHVAIVVE